MSLAADITSRIPPLDAAPRPIRDLGRGQIALLELVGNLGDSGPRTGLFLRLSPDRAAQADAPDRFRADIDGHPAAERDDLCEHALPRIGGLGAFRPFRGGHLE